MQIIRKYPDVGYLGADLWVPKTAVNVDGLKNSLTIPVKKKRGSEGTMFLWKETPTHIIVPREYFSPADLTDYPVLDIRPQTYPAVDIPSSIQLDVRNPGETIQRDAVEAMIAARGGILQLACGKGKAQPVTTPVATPDGWRPIGDLKPGDYVIGSDGRPTKVIGIFPQGVLPVFRVTMEDGTSTRCCAEHLWFTQTPSDRRKGLPGQVRSLTTIKNTLRTKAGAQHAVPRTSAVQYTPAAEVFEPWLMGFYLGDGNSSIYAGRARRVQLHKGDPGLHDRVAEILSRHDVVSKRVADPRSNNITTNVMFHTPGADRLWRLLVEMGLVGVSSLDKFIPQRYMQASVEERWDLVDGLLSADGSVTPTARTFSTSSPRLMQDMTELCRSLGCRVTVEERQTHYTYLGEKRAGAPSWRLYLSHDRWGQGRYNNKQYIQSVEPDGVDECVCIKVEAADELYVTEDFIVTHNTVCALELASRLGVPTLIVVDTTELIGQWTEEIELHLRLKEPMGLIKGQVNDWQKPVVLTTYQTLSKRAETLSEDIRRWFGLVIFDEGHHLSAEMFSKCANLFYGRRIGLTATPERADGTQVVYHSHLGEVLYKNLTQELKPDIYFYQTGITVDITDPRISAAVCDVNGEIHHGLLAGYMGGDRARLNLILDEVRKAYDTGRRTIVLSYSVDELINLFSLWVGREATVEDLPTPTPQEVGETCVPIKLDDRQLKRTEDSKATATRQLHANKHDAQKVQHYKFHLANLQLKLDQHRCAVKIENALKKRKLAFIAELLAEKSDAGLMIAAVKPDVRRQLLAEKRVVFAIMKYGREALNQPLLDTIMSCEPVNQKGSLQQLMGRVLRKKPGKMKPVVVFFEDSVGMSIGMCRNLRRFLKNWPPEESGPLPYSLVIHNEKQNIWESYK